MKSQKEGGRRTRHKIFVSYLSRRSVLRSQKSAEIQQALADRNVPEPHRQRIVADIERLVMRYPTSKIRQQEKTIALLCQLLVDLPPQESRVVKFLFRLLVRYRQGWQTTEIMEVVKRMKAATLVGLQELQRQFKQDEAEREASAAYLAAYRRPLQQYLTFLFGNDPVPLLELTTPEQDLGTYTDGRRIFLPYKFDLARGEDAAEQNVGMVFHSIVHEALHMGIKGHRGTYDLSFDTPVGQLLLKRLRRYRRTFDRNVANWDGQRVFEKIALEEGLDIGDRRAVLTDMVAFTLFASNSRLLQLLLNVFEDLRIEKIISGSQLRPFAERHRDLSVRRWPHVVLDQPSNALLRFFCQELTGLPLGRKPPESLQGLEATIKTRFADYHAMDINHMSPETSAVLSWELYRLIEKQAQGVADEVYQSAGASATEIAIRRQVASLIHQGPGGQGGKVWLPRRTEASLTGPDIYDEFDHHEGVVIEGATRVEVKPFVPKRTPYPPAPLRLFEMPRQPHGDRANQRSKRQFRFLEFGETVDMERIIPAVASARAGRPYDRRLYRERDAEAAKPLQSILIDLTVSMEQRRAGMEARSIQLAIDATKRIYQKSREQGFELHVYGVLDGGRRPVTLHKVNLADIDRIHCLGAGGARMGAAIRHLTRNTPTDRLHQIYIFTDDSGSYLRHGNDELVGRVWKNCASCQLRRLAGKGCHIELGAKAPAREGSIHESMEYQYADLDHAIRHLRANQQVYYVEFAVKPFTHLLDYYLPGRWWCSEGALDLSTLPRTPGMLNRGQGMPAK